MAGPEASAVGQADQGDGAVIVANKRVLVAVQSLPPDGAGGARVGHLRVFGELGYVSQRPLAVHLLFLADQS